MPEKFRNRVVFLPEQFEPEKVYVKHKTQIDKLKAEWDQTSGANLTKIKAEFPHMDDLEITVSPSLYGVLGSYKLGNGKITLTPRFDRKVINIYHLLINALTHYFLYDQKELINTPLWEEKQKKTVEIYNKLFQKTNIKSKGMLKVLDREFAGSLAQQSAQYLESLGFPNPPHLPNSPNLTKYESQVLKLLSDNRNKVVTFEQIGDVLWPEDEDKYSEYAITKLMERLKKKLPKYSIHAQRGKGYLLT
jgi:hypothetical protein